MLKNLEKLIKSLESGHIVSLIYHLVRAGNMECAHHLVKQSVKSPYYGFNQLHEEVL